MSSLARISKLVFMVFLPLLATPSSAKASSAAAQRQSSLSCDRDDIPGPSDSVPLQESAKATVFEDEVLQWANDARSHGADCGPYGRFAPTRPLLMHPLLRCAARKHAQDMATRQYFSHHSPEGQTPWRRMRAAGYASYRFAAENIAVGSEQPRHVIDLLMQDPPHCANIMNPKFEHVGIGYAPGASHAAPQGEEETLRHLTVQDFATPP